jgi:hypothetical protein
MGGGWHTDACVAAKGWVGSIPKAFSIAIGSQGPEYRSYLEKHKHTIAVSILRPCKVHHPFPVGPPQKSYMRLYAGEGVASQELIPTPYRYRHL